MLQGRTQIQGAALIAAAGGRGIVPMEINPGPLPQVYTDGWGAAFRDLAAGVIS
jgi:hypothetical protein